MKAGRMRLDNTANPIERCIHCGAELKTWLEVDDQVCNSCATALACDEDEEEEK
jgi:hypothetical protein